MTVDVVREKDSRLARQSWRFYYFDREHWLRCVHYAEESRPTLRHKYRVNNYYDQHDRRSRTVEKPPIPQDVAMEAREKFSTELGVDMDDDQVF